MAGLSPTAILLLFFFLTSSLFLADVNGGGGDVNELSLEPVLPQPDASSRRQTSGCCVRERKMKNVGLSEATGEDILVDVGHCRRRCGGKRRQMKKDELESLMLENPTMDPRLLFLLHSGSRRGVESCPGNQVCEESGWRVERVSTTEGVVSVTVTEGCQCQPRPHSCSRQPRPVTLHKGTPLQATLDLGHCQGHCPQDLGCRATKSRTVSVDGPNGVECVSVVEECGCEGECYRATKLLHVYNYTTPTVPEPQVIDVGTCIGQCDTAPEDQCVVREVSGECLMSLVKKSSRCSPTGLSRIQVFERDGTTRTLTTVTHCGCQ